MLNLPGGREPEPLVSQEIYFLPSFILKQTALFSSGKISSLLKINL